MRRQLAEARAHDDARCLELVASCLELVMRRQLAEARAHDGHEHISSRRLERRESRMCAEVLQT